MAALASDLRRQLENVCVQARELAEAAARSALQKRAVDAAEPFSHFNATDKELRVRLRARGRQVGDIRHANKTQAIDQVAQELAYEYWHRMLFARFLAENNLLMHPDGVPVSLEDCDQLARSEGTPNGFVLAARYASQMLPQVFRSDDVLMEIEFAPEQRLALEKLLASLPRETFLADDSLGWAYQFWQTKRNDEVNKSGNKIDGRTLPAVTQLFTEEYMVQFLLHNTIGAWWCVRHGITGQPDSAGVPAGQAPIEMEYLRWRADGTPAAGKFTGWPNSLREFTMLDPCCGSGHFLVGAFNLLVPLRMHDESLSAPAACEAVLRDNLFGLELDPRCTQIAAFALALAAWKYQAQDGQPLGYRALPPMNIACSGQNVAGKKDEWLVLANGDIRLREGMDKLHDLFSQAPHLGSLIDPVREAGDMFVAGFPELQPLLSKALLQEKVQHDADATAVGVAAQGIAKAAELLAAKYHLVSTNVPFLANGDFCKTIRDYVAKHHSQTKTNLATVFLQRCLRLCKAGGGTAGLVTPQDWVSLGAYKQLRFSLLAHSRVCCLAMLGPAAFQIMNWWKANTLLSVISTDTPDRKSQLALFDISSSRPASVKSGLLRNADLMIRSQADQQANPDSRITAHAVNQDGLLSSYTASLKGLSTGDSSRFIQFFWEHVGIEGGWVRFQGGVHQSCHYAGREKVLYWQDGKGDLANYPSAYIKGTKAWGKRGVSVNQMTLACTLYTGEAFDENAATIIPGDESALAAVWACCSSAEYPRLVRNVDKAAKVTNLTLTKIPFDYAKWQSLATQQYPDGLPGPHSDDPTQWLFQGEVVTSTDPLQVAVARMLGYHWPEQRKEADSTDAVADKDGIACIPAVRGKPPAAERLLEILRASYGVKWSNSVLHGLLMNAGVKVVTNLDDWLRNSFFDQHCRRFKQRPFIWHIWDGRKEGFSCLVNYHKLNHKTLENLTYSYLGDWINAQNADSKAGKVGADLRLAAAQALQEKLKVILAGEPPYDVFVRWKALSEQAIGWNPDLNDGVRMNIRPFVEADILRKTPNIKWTKDRGNEPERDKDEYPWFWNGKKFVGDRVNEFHLKNAVKLAARKEAK